MSVLVCAFYELSEKIFFLVNEKLLSMHAHVHREKEHIAELLMAIK
jgi:hypothetical protein